MGLMSKHVRNTLLVAMSPFLIAEGLMFYTILLNGRSLLNLLAPISLLTLFPIWSLQSILENPSYEDCIALTAIMGFDILFGLVMMFLISRSYRLPAFICSLIFMLLSIASYASGS